MPGTDRFQPTGAYIIGIARTPFCPYLGAFKGLTAPQLGAFAIEHAVAAAKVPPSAVDEVYFGCSLQAGLGQAPARTAALLGGLPDSVPCTAVNKVCASGMKAVVLAAQAIQLGLADVVVAGGMESMTRAPYLIPPRARTGLRYGTKELLDACEYDGLRDATGGWSIGVSGEHIAKTCGIDRVAQDAFAEASYRRTQAGHRGDAFVGEVVPVDPAALAERYAAVVPLAARTPLPAPPARSAPDPAVTLDQEAYRISVDRLRTIRTAFAKPEAGGTVTAGSSSHLSDGAVALVLVSGAYLNRVLAPRPRLRPPLTLLPVVLCHWPVSQPTPTMLSRPLTSASLRLVPSRKRWPGRSAPWPTSALSSSTKRLPSRFWPSSTGSASHGTIPASILTAAQSRSDTRLVPVVPASRPMRPSPWPSAGWRSAPPPSAMVAGEAQPSSLSVTGRILQPSPHRRPPSLGARPCPDRPPVPLCCAPWSVVLSGFLLSSWNRASEGERPSFDASSTHLHPRLALSLALSRAAVDLRIASTDSNEARSAEMAGVQPIEHRSTSPISSTLGQLLDEAVKCEEPPFGGCWVGCLTVGGSSGSRGRQGLEDSGQGVW